MKKLLLVIVMVLMVAMCASAQVSGAKGSGQYVMTVSGFSPVTVSSGTCQPGPAPTFQPCDISSQIQLGVPLTLVVVGAKAPVACTVIAGTMPSGWTLVSSTSEAGCVLTAMTAVNAAFTIGFVGAS